jgi:PAS domain S-box-containing protein
MVRMQVANADGADSGAADPAPIGASNRDAIVGMTRSGVISSFSPAASRMLGFPAAEIVGHPSDIMIPPAQRSQEASVLRRVLAGETVDPYLTDRSRRDGGLVAVWVTVSAVLDPAGAISGAATMSHRAAGSTEHQNGGPVFYDGEQTAMLEAARREAPAAAAAHQSRDHRDRFQVRMVVERAKERLQVQEAQDRFQVRMEVERAEERVQVQEAQDRFQVRMGIEQAKERVEVRDAQDRFQVRMGAERAREREHVQNAQDRFQLGIDAERVEAQAEHDHLQAQLQQSQRLEVLGQLAGGVAHDFNNLLAVILNYAAFVAEEIDAQPGTALQAAGRDIGQIQRAAERATALTHQLLAFARREVVQPRVLDLNTVVTDVEQLLTRTLGEDIVLHTELTDGLWPVLADVGQIEQVLVNLAVNARHAMSDGGALSIETANLAAGSLLPDGRQVRLQIGDTGSGMTTDVSDHIFEPFFTTKPDGTGTGLGLATVYGIVTQAGGTIRVQSVPGAGTTFTIMLPVTDQVAVSVEQATPFRREPRGETILVVEDEEALREVTERIFTRNGYRVLTAADGVEAVALAAQHVGDIHLLVTDVVMPYMLGKEVAERIRQVRPDIDVLYMSGYAQPVLASQGRLDRDVNLIEKPFSAATLVEAVGQILNARLVDGRAPAAEHD